MGGVVIRKNLNNTDVVILTSTYYPVPTTSAQLPHQTAKHLVSQGLGVTVLCQKTEGVDTKEEIEGVEVERVGHASAFNFLWGMVLKLRTIRQHKVLMVYNTSKTLMFIAMLSKLLYNIPVVKVVYTVQPDLDGELGRCKHNGVYYKLTKYLTGGLYKYSDCVVAISDDMKNYLIKHRHVNPSSITVIENWAIEEHYGLSGVVTKLTKTTKQDTYLTVSYLGTMGDAQDLDTLLQAMSDSRLKNQPYIQFVFAGSGTQVSKVKGVIRDQSIRNATIHGYLTGDDFTKLLYDSDVYLLTLKESLTGLEVPSKFYTYLYQTKVIVGIISSETDISKSITQHRLGKVVDNGDVEGLVDALLELVKTLPLVDNQVYRNYYSREIQCNKYLQVIKTLIKKGERQ